MSDESILRGIRDKRSRQIIRDAVRRGWELTMTGRNHIRLRHPSGAVTYTAGTSRDRFDSIRLARDIEKIERNGQTAPRER